MLSACDLLQAYVLLQLEYQTSADGFHDTRRAALLPTLRVGNILVILGGDVDDGAAAHGCRYGVCE